jgi:hypothetical protein
MIPSPESPTPLGARRLPLWAWIVLAAILVGALGAGWKIHNEHDARVAQAGAQFGDAKNFQQRVTKLSLKLNGIDSSYYRLENDARQAGQRRHDSDDIAVQDREGKRELADVEKMSAVAGEGLGVASELLDAYDERYSGATSPLRGLLREFEVDRSDALSAWQDAINTIVDANHDYLIGGDGISDGSVKTDYDKFAHDETRAIVAQESLEAGLHRLLVRARKDAADRKRALDSVR